jgi:DNA (cytosine-5)-methyltransferase 1
VTVRRPRLLDLFCKAGGASRGYADAGFDVVGVDIEAQPNYPYKFEKADATTFPFHGFDAVVASPPCTDYSALAALQPRHDTAWMLPHMIARFRGELGAVPWVVENVEGAREQMSGALRLCGSEFGLGAAGRILKRHRLFLSNVPLMGAGGCTCAGKPKGGVYGNGGGGVQTRGYKFKAEDSRQAMRIDWMTRSELSNAIPPKYTEFIGEQIMTYLNEGTTS